MLKRVPPTESSLPSSLRETELLLIDMDGTQVDSITSDMERRMHICAEIYCHPAAIRALNAKEKALYSKDPLRYLRARIKTAEKDWRRAAQETKLDVWDVRVISRLGFLRTTFGDAAAEQMAHTILNRHPPRRMTTPFEGIPALVDRFRQHGSKVIILTDAEPAHARRMAIESGMGYRVDALIGRDYFDAPDPAGDITLKPLAWPEPDAPPHLVLGNLHALEYPKYIAGIYDKLEMLTGISKSKMALLDDHPDIIDLAEEQGVISFLARLYDCSDTTRMGFKAFAPWTPYFKAYDELFSGTREVQRLLSRPEDIFDYLRPVPAPDLHHIAQGTCLRMKRGGAPSFFTP